MENKEKVFYYCHSIKSNKKIETGNRMENCDGPYQVKVYDKDDKDVILDYLGIQSENDLLKFVVHIYITK